MSSMVEPRDFDRWGQCEAYALSTPVLVGRTSVHRWVTALAIGHLGGVEIETPTRVAFDGLTPDAHTALAQGLAIANAAHEALDARGWTIMERDARLARNAALQLWNREQRSALAVIVTDQIVGSAWLAAGALAPPLSTAWCAVLHVPRQRLGRDQQCSMELREAMPVIEEWERRDARFFAVRQGDRPMRTPGAHCERCGHGPTCPVSTSYRK